MFGLTQRSRTRRARSSSKSTPRRLRHEPLESRRLLAGDVIVTVNASGDVMVTGDGQENLIMISDSLTGIRITGDDTNIVFDGDSAASQEIPTSGIGNVDRDLILHMGSGDDQILVEQINVGRTLHASLNGGNDELAVVGTNVFKHLRINGASGDDTTTLDLAKVSGSLKFNGNSGADYLKATYVDAYGGLTFNGADGDDRFVADVLDMQDTPLGGTSTATANGGYGEDQFDVDALNATIDFHGHEDADIIVVTGRNLAGVNIDAGAAADQVTIENAVILGDLEVHLRSTNDPGNDVAEVTNSVITGDVALRGGTGTQVVSVQDGSHVNGILTIALGGGEDVSVIVGSEIDGRTMIRSGSGADNVSMSDSTFHARVDALLGGANDQFFTGQSDVFGVFLNVEGGSGSSDRAMVSNNLLSGASFDSIEQLDVFPNET